MEKREKNNKKNYMAPKATFVPLKIEERLLTCGKVGSGGSTQCSGAGSKPASAS